MTLQKPAIALVLLVLVLLNTGHAQTFSGFVIRGKIINDKREPLGSATVAITSRGMATVTNSAGLFTLRVPDNGRYDTLRVSLVGYHNKSLSIGALFATDTIVSITLVQSVIELSEVVVRQVDALELMKKAVQKIPANIFDRPGVTEGFYRELVKRDDDPVVLSEAVLAIFNHGEGSNKEPQLKLIQKRSIQEENKTKGLEFGMSPKSVLELDIARTIDASDIFSEADFKKYLFRFKGELVYDGINAIAIGFDQRESVKESLYRGTVYLDKNTLAFIAFDMSRNTKGLRYAKYGTGKMRLLLKIMGISITLKKSAYRIRYRQYGNKWILSSAKMNTRLVFKSKRRQYNFLCDIDGDYVNTEIDTLQNIPFDKTEVLLMNKSIQFNADEPEAIFWKDHNIILADYDEKKVIEKIQASNNSGNLRQIIEEKIGKFPKDKTGRIDSILSFYHQRGSFNGNALVKMGEVIFRKSYGLADRERNLKLTEYSAFRIGSLSKSFTAMMILQLQQSGKLSLEDSIGRFFTDYRHGNITIEQLLTHTSGIPNFTTGDNDITNALSERMTPEEMVRKFGSDTLDFQPGTEFRYSNLGYTVLAAIIEKLSGQSYRQAVKAFVFSPLKMTESGFALDSLNTKGYLFGQPEPAYPVANMAGGGGISSTLDDLVKWDQALNDTLLLNKKILTELFKPRSEYKDWGADYGYGWMIDRFLFNESRKHPIFYHPGTDLGYYSMFARQPDKKILIILLNNTGDFERFDMTDLILTEINR